MYLITAINKDLSSISYTSLILLRLVIRMPNQGSSHCIYLQRGW